MSELTDFLNNDMGVDLAGGWNLASTSGDDPDESGNGIVGVITVGTGQRGAAAIETGGTLSLKLSGSDGGVVIDNDEAIGNLFHSGATLFGLFHIDAFPTTSATIAFKNGWFVTLSNNGRLTFTKTFTTGQYAWTTATGYVATGKSYGFCITYEAALGNHPTLYVRDLSEDETDILTNGAGLTRSGTSSGSPASDLSNNLNLGSLNNVTSFFNGRLSVFRFYEGIVSETDILSALELANASSFFEQEITVTSEVVVSATRLPGKVIAINSEVAITQVRDLAKTIALETIVVTQAIKDIPREFSVVVPTLIDIIRSHTRQFLVGSPAVIETIQHRVFFAAVEVVAAATVSLTKQVNLTRSLGSSVTVVVSRAVARIFTLDVPAMISMNRLVAKNLALTSEATISQTRLTDVMFVFFVESNIVVNRGIAISIPFVAAAQTLAVRLSAISLSVISLVNSTVKRQTGKNVLAVSSATTTRVRHIYQFTEVVVAAIPSSSVVTSRFRTITFNAVTSITMLRQTAKNVSVEVPVVPTLDRSITTIFQIVAAVTVFVQRKTNKIVAFESSATITMVRAVARELTFTSEVIVSLARHISVIYEIVASANIVVTRFILKNVSFIVAAEVTMERYVRKTISFASSAETYFFIDVMKNIMFTAQANVTLERYVARTFVFVAAAEMSVKRDISRTFAFVAPVIYHDVRLISRTFALVSAATFFVDTFRQKNISLQLAARVTMQRDMAIIRRVTVPVMVRAIKFLTKIPILAQQEVSVSSTTKHIRAGQIVLLSSWAEVAAEMTSEAE